MRRIRNGTVPNPQCGSHRAPARFPSPVNYLTSRKISLMADSSRDFPVGCLSIISLSRGGQARYRLMRRRASNEQRSWRYLDIINRMIDRLEGRRSYRVILLGLFATLFGQKAHCDWIKTPSIVADRRSRNRLHPIVTGCTASVESSAIAAHCHHQLWRAAFVNAGRYVCRLVRESSRVAAYSVWGQWFGVPKIADASLFHIRFRRHPRCLLAAGCWWKETKPAYQ